MLTVRELSINDIGAITDYWLNSDRNFLQSIGVDLSKLPDRKTFTDMLTRQYYLPITEKYSCCLIWEYDNIPIGHCNTNPTRYGKDAFLHLHIWEPVMRRKGSGAILLKKSLSFFFERLEIQTLYSEPFAGNTAPINTLAKAGFRFVQEYRTIPGSINFEQPVQRWEMTRTEYKRLYDNGIKGKNEERSGTTLSS